MRQPRQHRESAPMPQHQQSLRQQPLLHLARGDDRVPVPIVVLGGEHVNREHPCGKCRARRFHHPPGRRSSGHWICDSSCVERSVSSASSKSTSGSTSARIVSSSESNMWIRTSRHSFTGSSLKCWCHRKWSTTIRSPFFQRWCWPLSGAVPRKLWPYPSTTWSQASP